MRGLQFRPFAYLVHRSLSISCRESLAFDSLFILPTVKPQCLQAVQQHICSFSVVYHFQRLCARVSGSSSCNRVSSLSAPYIMSWLSTLCMQYCHRPIKTQRVLRCNAGSCLPIIVGAFKHAISVRWHQATFAGDCVRRA